MKKIRFLFMAFATFLLVGVAGVSAEEYSSQFKTLTSDGTLTVSFMNNDPRDWILVNYLNTFSTDQYNFITETCNEDFTMCSIGLIYNDSSVENEYHDIKISYKQVYSDNYKKLTSDGKLTIKSKLANTPQDWLYLYISSFNSTNYSFELNGCNEDYSVCSINGFDSITGNYEQHDVAITYVEEYSDMFKALAPNNKMSIPSMNYNGNEEALRVYFESLRSDDYSYNYSECNEDYSECLVGIFDNNFQIIEQHKVQLTYKETFSNEFKKILKDGKFIVKESSLNADKIWLIRDSIIRYNTENYWFNIDSCNEDYSTCRVTAYFTNGLQEQHDVKVTYKEEYSDTFKKILKDGKIVITSSTVGDKMNLVGEYTNSFWNDKYSFSLGTCNDDITKCEITLYNNNPYQTEKHVINISYKEKYSEEFNKIITDGKLVIPSVKPKNSEESDFFLQNYLNNMSTNNHEYWPGTCNEDYSICDISLYIYDEKGNATYETHKLKITYSKLDENKATQVNKVLASIPKNKTFVVEDLELVNYLINSGYTNEKLYYSSEAAYINYSSELKELLGNSNITASLEIRGGGFAIFAPSNIGGYILSYDGVAYGLFHGGAMKKYVIYIPDETEESTDAYIKAAQKRIDNYLGKGIVKIQYTGKLSQLEYSDHEELGLGNKLKDEYYTITYKDCSFDFLIVKDSSKMKEISQQSTNDVMTNISISMNSSTLPLDTSIKVAEISKQNKKYQEITNKLSDKSYDVSNALIYDLKLYSSSNKEYITKLKDGNFEVKIPVSKEFKGKDLIVYYVHDDGKVDEHEVTIKDGYAVFTTNHFSIYTLTEKTGTNSTHEIENPNTFDGILTYFVTGIISLVGLSMLGLYSMKLNKMKRDY